jgi:hypothetical protein
VIRQAICALIMLAAPAAAGEKEMRQFLDALRRVETGGLPAAGIGAFGDNGASIGPYQIQRGYWTDSRQKAGRYEDCLRDARYSEQVMRGYWARYCPDALASEDWETLARVHNGGPRGAKKKATEAYWAKVKREMTR